ncbi:hypothetical protein [Sporichthya polymorpha]|uniref:hypothetical protein n=1 Tax=Sporichthya polymorpha TaxID=35751 RepID=UPI00036DF8C1|nr:hypothetical protein [Sporichthya polymorpha]
MASDPFVVVDVTAWPVRLDEPAGGEEKWGWLEAPDGQLWLFKPRSQRDGRTQGEDWAEKIAAELGKLVGLPCATVELAIRGGRVGTLSLDLRPERWSLHSGAQLLAGADPDYVPRTKASDGTVVGRDRRGHSLMNIQRALAGVAPPPGAGVPPGFGAFDVFTAYVMFDAWIANQDRHEENWAVLRGPTVHEPDRLAGSFDHGSSLSYRLPDSERLDHLHHKTVGAWAAKGKAAKFERHPSGRRWGLVEHAAHAFSLVRPEVRAYWTQRLQEVTPPRTDEILHRVPDLSDPTRTFLAALLAINQRRLLDAC